MFNPLSLINLLASFFTAANIGFTRTSYSTPEGAGRVKVMIGVLQGTLGKSFDINIDTFRHGPLGEILGEAIYVHVTVIYSPLGDCMVTLYMTIFVCYPCRQWV